MRFTTKAMIVALTSTTLLAGPVSAELTGDLRIFLDTSNPAPRATMEAMIGQFFIAIIIARLVSIYTVQEQAEGLDDAYPDSPISGLTR